MTTLAFLLEWTLRSSILIASGLLLLKLLRVRDPATQLVACIVLLAGSLFMPALTFLAPRVGIPISRVLPESRDTTQQLPSENSTLSTLDNPRARQEVIRSIPYAKPLNVTLLLLLLYSLGVSVMLIRLLTGLIMGGRLIKRSRSLHSFIADNSDISDMRESDEIAVPVTMGGWRRVILLPNDWPDWNTAKLAAVLAHERSHAKRRDPLVQVISAIHRSLLWHNPLSWYLHSRIVQLAEEASDDIAMAAIGDRGYYAEILLDFMQRGHLRARPEGVAMARYGSVDKRIDRILDEVKLSRGVTCRNIVVVLILTTSLVFVAAAAHPRARQAVRSTIDFESDSTAPMRLSALTARPTQSATNAEKTESSTAVPDTRRSTRAQFDVMGVTAKADQVQPTETAPASPGADTAGPGSLTASGSTPPSPEKQLAPTRAHGAAFEAYAIISKNSETGSFDVFKDPVTGQVIDDVSHASQLRSRFGNDFAWFRRDGKEFVVTDSEIVSASARALAPEEEFAHTRGKLDKLLTALRHQNNSSNPVSSILIQQLQGIEAELGRQSSVAGLAEQLHTIVLDLQSSAADEQRQSVAPKLTRLQTELSQKGNRLAEEFHRTFRGLLNVATEKGLAQEISFGV